MPDRTLDAIDDELARQLLARNLLFLTTAPLAAAGHVERAWAGRDEAAMAAYRRTINARSIDGSRGGDARRARAAAGPSMAP